MNERRYLSIGEVLGLLLEEFPDVTISKIRFLESQGLIDPERTSSGYRKFYDTDVETLRLILREQRDYYLPLKVIKDRIDNGELGTAPPATRDETPPGVARLRRELPFDEPEPFDDEGLAPEEAAAEVDVEPTPEARQERRASVLTADELCALAGVGASFLDDLESFGILPGRPPSAAPLYDADGVDAVVAAAALCRLGLEPRHLRAWRSAVDKELSLIEQLAGPLLRQQHGSGHEQATELATTIDAHGNDLRDALTRASLRRLLG